MAFAYPDWLTPEIQDLAPVGTLFNADKPQDQILWVPGKSGYLMVFMAASTSSTPISKLKDGILRAENAVLRSKSDWDRDYGKQLVPIHDEAVPGKVVRTKDIFRVLEKQPLTSQSRRLVDSKLVELGLAKVVPILNSAISQSQLTEVADELATDLNWCDGYKKALKEMGVTFPVKADDKVIDCKDIPTGAIFEDFYGIRFLKLKAEKISDPLYLTLTGKNTGARLHSFPGPSPYTIISLEEK